MTSLIQVTDAAPCRACGSRYFGLGRRVFRERDVHVICGCGAAGPYAKSRVEAVAAWDEIMRLEKEAGR